MLRSCYAIPQSQLFNHSQSIRTTCHGTLYADSRERREERVMTEQRLVPRQVAPYLVSGATGLHILVRMWRLSRLPASDAPLHAFLLNHADVLIVLGSGPVVVWQVAKQHYLHQLAVGDNAEGSLRTLLAH